MTFKVTLQNLKLYKSAPNGEIKRSRDETVAQTK